MIEDRPPRGYQRECFRPDAILRCAHLDGDVLQAWSSEGGSYVIEGLPVVTYAREDFDVEWTHRVGLLRTPATADEPR